MIKKYPGIIEIMIGFFSSAIATLLIIAGAVVTSNPLILAACILYIIGAILVSIGIIRLVINYRKHV